jgi:cilia- and flagella-associated protein 52
MQMASVGNDKRITFWDIRTPEPTRVVADAHAGDVACVAINRAGTLLATGGGDAMVKLWDFRSTSLLSQVMYLFSLNTVP